MKFQFVKGMIQATAETKEESITLLSLDVKTTKVEKPAFPNGKKAKNPWKGKHRKACPTCGGMYLNMMKHTNSAHKTNHLGDVKVEEPQRGFSFTR